MIFHFLFFLLFARRSGVYSTKLVNVREIEKRILDKVLDTDRYDNKIRPDGTAGTGEEMIYKKLSEKLEQTHHDDGDFAKSEVQKSFPPT